MIREGHEPGTRRTIDRPLIRRMAGESWFLMLNHFLATIFFQIDVFNARHNRLSQQQLSLLLAPHPLAAVALAPAGNHHRARSLGKQSVQVHRALDIVQPQFHELSAVFRQVLVLGD